MLGIFPSVQSRYFAAPSSASGAQFVDIGEDMHNEEHFYYAVMEVVSGTDLQQILDSQGFVSPQILPVRNNNDKPSAPDPTRQRD